MNISINKWVALSCAALTFLASCKKDGTLIETNGGKAGSLSISASAIVLSKASLADTAKVLNISFTQPTFGFAAAVTNTLQLDAASDNWASPRSVTLPTNVLKIGYATADLNNLLLKLNLPTGKSSQVMIRVMSTIAGTVAPVYSNVTTVSATPFALISFMYVPGAYQGWNIATADSLISATGNGVYTGIINFSAAYQQFKVTPKKSWEHSYGLDPVTAAVKLDGAGAYNFYSPAAGLYWVTLDANALTLTYVKVTKYYSLIGSATTMGWGGDVDMTYNNGTQSWNVIAPLTSTGGFKVRTNHDWGVSYGYISPADGMTLTSASGANMTVPVSGNYNVTFQLNAKDVAGLTATYTVTKQ